MKLSFEKCIWATPEVPSVASKVSIIVGVRVVVMSVVIVPNGAVLSNLISVIVVCGSSLRAVP